MQKCCFLMHAFPSCHSNWCSPDTPLTISLLQERIGCLVFQNYIPQCCDLAMALQLVRHPQVLICLAPSLLESYIMLKGSRERVRYSLICAGVWRKVRKTGAGPAQDGPDHEWERSLTRCIVVLAILTALSPPVAPLLLLPEITSCSLINTMQIVGLRALWGRNLGCWVFCLAEDWDNLPLASWQLNLWMPKWKNCCACVAKLELRLLIGHP